LPARPRFHYLAAWRGAEPDRGEDGEQDEDHQHDNLHQLQGRLDLARRRKELHPLNEVFLEAGRQAGYPFTEDVNGREREGFCRFDMNADHGYGLRVRPFARLLLPEKPK
jgi:choline dehydrogenase-like flavoprotein